MKARLPQGMGGGPSNMNQMIRQAQKMQAEMAAVQEQLNETEYVSTAGGGMVEAAVNGKHEVLRLKLAPEVVDPDDVEMLEDLIAAAVNGAIRDAVADSQHKLGAVTGAMPGMPGVL